MPDPKAFRWFEKLTMITLSLSKDHDEALSPACGRHKERGVKKNSRMM
jgi:hypothetical protein